MEADVRHTDIIVSQLGLKKASNTVVIGGAYRGRPWWGASASCIARWECEQRTSQRTRRTLACKEVTRLAAIEAGRTLSCRRTRFA